MNTITGLWLPILVSAIVVFFASWLVHMLLPHHRSDMRKLSNEGDVLEAIRRAGVGPGDYRFPFCTFGEMKNPEFRKKLEAGPVGVMTVMRPGSMGMGTSLVAWFIYLLVVGVFVAYLTSRTVEPGADYLPVFRVAGTVAFLAYAGAEPAASIWYKRAWGTTLKFILDGLLYGLLTAGVFGWLWT